MAVKSKQPCIVSVTRKGKIIPYELSDDKDWAVLFDSTVLEIKEKTGEVHYWPLDSIDSWDVCLIKVTTPLS